VEKPKADYFFQSSYQAGVSFGTWANQGGMPADSVDDPNSLGYYTSDFSSTSFYLEGNLSYWLSRNFMGELSIGSVSRGDVILNEEFAGEVSSSYGTLMIYPVMLKLKYYPYTGAGKFYPYFSAGAGIYYGRHDITIVSGTNSYFNSIFDQASKTDFTYMIGGGFDWPLASVVAMEFGAQYLPIKYSDDLIGIDDYSAITITLGFKYLFSAEKDNSEKKGKHRR